MHSTSTPEGSPTNSFFKFFILFSLFSFYTLSTSANINLFHFVLDVNLAKLGMLTIFAGLMIFVFEETVNHWKNLKIPLMIISLWIVYLLISSYLSELPGVSFKYTLRIIGCWLISFEICFLLHTKNVNYQRTIGYSLIFTLLMVTLLWNLDYRSQETLGWFKDRQTNRMDHRITGLYINPNELGYALVMHTLLIIWFIRDKLYYLPVILPIGYWGVYMSGSKNSFLGFTLVSLFGIIWWAKKTTAVNKKISFLLVLIFLIFMGFIASRYKFLPERVNLLTENIFYSLLSNDEYWQKMHEEGLIGEKTWRENQTFGTLTLLYKQILPPGDPRDIIDYERKLLYKFAINTLKDNPWVGIGIGVFSNIQPFGAGKHTHNFILGILVEQGVIGMTFMLVLFLVLVAQMKSWIGSFMLICVPLTLIFDDLSWSYIFPMYASVLMGICFYYSSRVHNIV